MGVSMARRSASESSEDGVERSVELSALLSAARRLAGVSQQSLAQGANVSIGSVVKLETGRSPEPGFFVVSRIATTLRQKLTGADRGHFESALHDLLLFE
jgi:transcriptional regulator with XRE-family HTH domain